ncbi:DUF357 domain-containing protein [Candidatus Woesearchaeota archaeon]|nr:DUF357 domain-containing protein [Candidatus Woesearchaeota archaeon]
MKEVTEEKMNRDIDVTKRALEKAKIIVPENSHLFSVAKDFYDMAERYFNDALHFKEKGDFVRADTAVYYAHAWLDAGARLGVFDVQHDSTLFTVD